MTYLAFVLVVACRPPDTAPDRPTPTTPSEPTPPEPTPPEPPAFGRAVVLPASPLALANPQEDLVTWPIWGGATPLAEAASIRVTIAAVGDGGLLIAGPTQRGAVELRSTGGAWSLRETQAGNLFQDIPLDAPGVTSFVLELAPEGASVRALWDGGEGALVLSSPLGAQAGDIAGLYANLEPGAELAIGDLAMSTVFPSHPELGVPLRELAAGRVQIGSAIDIWPPVHDAGFESLFGEQFDGASPTEFYWPTTRGEDEDWFFVPADLAVNYATVHGQQVTGMFLVWDFELPRWVKDLYGDREALGAVYDEHVTTLVSRYRGKVDAWVVVNEAIWGPGDAGNNRAQWAQTIWYDTLGVEHIERAFLVARAADPDAVLLYNETGAEAVNPKSDFLYDMAADFLDRGIPLDGVGLQFHLHAGDPPDLAEVQENFERFAALGLDVYITELDVSLEGLDQPDELELQAGLYADVLEVCLAVPACRSWTVFGFSDRYAWDELGDATPLLFDEDYVAKPAFYSVQSALGR